MCGIAGIVSAEAGDRIDPAAIHRDQADVRIADDARAALRDGAAHPADYRPFGAPRYAAHRDVERAGA